MTLLILTLPFVTVKMMATLISFGGENPDASYLLQDGQCDLSMSEKKN